MRHVLAAVLCKPNNCHREAAESYAQASDSQRRISVLVAEPTRLIWANGDKKSAVSRCSAIRTTAAASLPD